ncbi:MAG: prohibitin family protein [Bacteroidales bacterium]|nr:prohibitin family protein [Bacteroidales bacterium]
MFKILQPGERGIVFRPYSSGLNKEKIFMPGFHVIAPWNDLIIYNVKEQKLEETMDVLDKNSLSINLDVSIRFNPVYDRIAYLHETFGQDYIRVLVVPEIRSAVRRVTGRYTAEEIFSTKRNEVETEINEETAVNLKENNIDMRALLIRSIKLPDQIKQAIENKLKQEQEALAYQFKLDKEQSEAQRKRIEAEGIANFNRIISASLSDNILQQRGIDATLELSKSENTKVIVIGSGKNGMPLILNTDK